MTEEEKAKESGLPEPLSSRGFKSYEEVIDALDTATNANRGLQSQVSHMSQDIAGLRAQIERTPRQQAAPPSDNGDDLSWLFGAAGQGAPQPQLSPEQMPVTREELAAAMQQAAQYGAGIGAERAAWGEVRRQVNNDHEYRQVTQYYVPLVLDQRPDLQYAPKMRQYEMAKELMNQQSAGAIESMFGPGSFEKAKKALELVDQWSKERQTAGRVAAAGTPAQASMGPPPAEGTPQAARQQKIASALKDDEVDAYELAKLIDMDLEEVPTE